jgi:hypothetical protein
MPGRTFNIVDDEPLTRREYADALARAAGTAMWLRGPGRAAVVFGDRLTSLTRSLRVSNARFRAAIGWARAIPARGRLDRHRNSAQQPHSGVGSHHRPLRDPSASGPGPCRHLPGPTMRTARGRDCTSAGSAEHADDAGRSSDHWMVRVDVDQERGHPCTAPPARSCAEPPPSHQPPAPAATVSHRTPVWRPCAA